jgi:membrane-bound lytic murein transglycosylase B
MILPAEKELRAVLARFAQARIEHDVRPTGSTRALEDTTYTLCVMTGARTVEQALLTADTVLEQYASRKNVSQADETLAA